MSHSGPSGIQQTHHVKRPSDSSSNALVSPHPSQTYIPMKEFQHHSTVQLGKSEEIEHDPLPPAVDFTGLKPSTHYQFRALARRALSYHRRQRNANVCCLVIWPVLLVLLSFIFSIIGASDPEFTGMVGFCVNEADPQTSQSFSLGGVPKPTTGSKVNAAWYPRSFWSQSEGGSAAIIPCVRWFGESYPAKAPFENTTTTEPHSFYIPPPSTGWFSTYDLLYNSSRWPGQDEPPALWRMRSINQTILYTTANPQIAQALGTFPNVTRDFISPVWPPKDPNIIYNSTASGSGILGAVSVRYASARHWAPFNRSDPNPESSVRYTSQTFMPFKDQATLDQAVVDMITAASNASQVQDIENLPFGAVAFDALNPAQSSIKMTMQFGQPPLRYTSGLRATSGLKQLIMMTQMSKAMVKTKFAGQYVISQGLRALPFEWSADSFKGYTLNRLSVHLFPFGLSFLLPTFVSIMVQEKEDRHRMMMAMNGLKSGAYYLGHYVEFMIMQLILSLFFCLACLAISSQLILRTNPLIMIVLLVVWAHVQTCMAFLFASVFSNTRRATLIVYFFVAISCIMTSVSEQIFSDGVPFAWFIHPTFSFFHILKVGIMQSSRVNGLFPLRWADFAAGTTLSNCLILILGESVLFILLTLYLDAVAPSEYGVQKPWHFPITSLFKRNRRSRDPEAHLASHVRRLDSTDDTLEGADADVYAERDRVRTHYEPSKTPLIIDNLFHRYRGKVEPALRGMSFGVETNTVLGLLGPNGAGKSTMIHLLTGLYSPTMGTAYVAGADIRTDMAIVHSKIGVCPQHDILWGDLTVADHLLFYSRLRGIPPSLEKQAITYAIASVSLTKFRDRQVKGLSGGEKRRVSIAIALLGDNSVIFLDEPSTGLDPAVRRVIWDIINRVKVNRTIVLTTHSMEEADILSDRIAIMTTGRLRCIGTSLHLKELYGSGFRLDISSKPGRLEEACESVVHQLLQGLTYRRIDKFTNSTTFEFELQQQQQQPSAGRGQLSKIFSFLSRTDMFPAIEDWGVSQTTLEDVFIKIVTEGDSAIAMPSV